jgi:hypothetical protein
VTITDKKCRLVEILERASRNVPAPLGFAAAPTQARRTMVLVAAIPPDNDLAKAAVANGADALIVRPDGAGAISSDAWDELSSSVKDVPAGLELAAGAEDDYPSSDYLVAPLKGAPASLIKAAPAGLFVSINARYPVFWLRALPSLKVAGIFVTPPKEAGPLSIEDLLRFRSLAGMAGLPVLAILPTSANPDNLALLRDAGVVGVIVEVASGDEGSLGRLSVYAEAIRSLPPRPTRRDSGARVSLAPPEAPEPDDEDEEEFK